MKKRKTKVLVIHDGEAIYLKSDVYWMALKLAFLEASLDDEVFQAFKERGFNKAERARVNKAYHLLERFADKLVGE